MSPLLPILVIADDLSGAAEIAAIAAARGLATEVHREFEPSSRAEVIAIDTDTRQPDADIAAARVRTIAAHPRFRQSRVFKKVDSVLRGHPRAETESLMQATNRQQAVLAPINPSRGRIISQGNYLIDGVPLNQTAFANDKDFPRHSSSIEALLPSHGKLSLNVGGRIESPLSAGITVPDIGSLAELASVAALVDDSVLAAGGADFFEVMLDRWQTRSNVEPMSSTSPIAATAPSLGKPALLVCGSRIAWPQRLAACQAAQIPVQVSNGHGDWPEKDDSPLLSLNAGLVGIGSDDQPDRDRALAGLGAFASQAIQSGNLRTVLVEGGATAAEIVNQLGWKRFAVQPGGFAGVGFLRPIDAPAAPILLIKPGSYPWPPQIWQSFAAG